MRVNKFIKNKSTINNVENKNTNDEINDDENILKILHLINNSNNIFITGHAGTGKSYILNKLKQKLFSSGVKAENMDECLIDVDDNKSCLINAQKYLRNKVVDKKIIEKLNKKKVLRKLKGYL